MNYFSPVENPTISPGGCFDQKPYVETLILLSCIPYVNVVGNTIHFLQWDGDRGSRYISEQEFKTEKLDVSNLSNIRISNCNE